MYDNFKHLKRIWNHFTENAHIDGEVPAFPALGGNIEPVLQESRALARHQPYNDPAVQPLQQAEADPGEIELQ
jgi:hypothetical protein